MYFIPNRCEYAGILFKTLGDERSFSSSEYSMSAEPSLAKRQQEETTDTGCSSTEESPCTTSYLGKAMMGFGESHKTCQSANSDATQGSKITAWGDSRTPPLLLYLNAF